MSRAYPNHSVWGEIAPEILPTEFKHPWEMHPSTLRRLATVRRASGVPLRFVSDYRTPDDNRLAGGASKSAHMSSPCHAVDIRVLSASERWLVMVAAIEAGFTRIGIYPPTPAQVEAYGKNSGSLHLDDSPDHPPGVIWVNK